MQIRRLQTWQAATKSRDSSSCTCRAQALPSALSSAERKTLHSFWQVLLLAEALQPVLSQTLPQHELRPCSHPRTSGLPQTVTCACMQARGVANWESRHSLIEAALRYEGSPQAVQPGEEQGRISGLQMFWQLSDARERSTAQASMHMLILSHLPVACMSRADNSVQEPRQACTCAVAYGMQK